MTSNCSNKSFSSIFFSVHFIFLVLRFGDLDRRKRNGPTGSFIVIFGSELPDKMYGVCYDDSSQNNIMTDIDKHSQKPYSTPFLTRGSSWVKSNIHFIISIFSNISIIGWTCPKNCTCDILRQELLFVGTIPTRIKKVKLIQRNNLEWPKVASNDLIRISVGSLFANALVFEFSRQKLSTQFPKVIQKCSKIKQKYPKLV